MEPPLVSILTPSYNQGRFLRDTLESVCMQDYPRVEHIVVDGRSTDCTLSLLKEYESRITYISEPDKGFAEALNKAMTLAKGEIIGWLNTDDFYLRRDVVSGSVAALRQGADVVYGHAVYINRDGLLLKVSMRPRFSSRRLKAFDFIPQPTAFFRRAVAPEPLVPMGLDFAIDYALWLELTRRGARFVRWDEIAAAIRYHSDAKSVRDQSVGLEETRALRSTSHVRRLPLAWDFLAMSLLKLHGLWRFYRLDSTIGDSPIKVSVPRAILRPLYQIGLKGPRGTTMQFPRAVAELARRPH